MQQGTKWMCTQVKNKNQNSNISNQLDGLYWGRLCWYDMWLEEMSCLATITRWNRYTSSQETPLTIRAWEILERMSGKVLRSRGLLHRCQSSLRQWSLQDSNAGTRKDPAPCRTGSRDAGRACGAAYTWLEKQPAAHLLDCGKMLSSNK